MWDLPEDDVYCLSSIVLYLGVFAHSNKFHQNTCATKTPKSALLKMWKSAGQPPVDWCCWQGVGVPNTLLVALSSQTSIVPWVRVMASLHWAALRYCRITEQLIETNDSNNGTLSPQAGFVVGLISVAVAARRTSHHADPSEERRRSSLFMRAVGDFYTNSV